MRADVRACIDLRARIDDGSGMDAGRNLRDRFEQGGDAREARVGIACDQRGAEVIGGVIGAHEFIGEFITENNQLGALITEQFLT